MLEVTVFPLDGVRPVAASHIQFSRHGNDVARIFRYRLVRNDALGDDMLARPLIVERLTRHSTSQVVRKQVIENGDTHICGATMRKKQRVRFSRSGSTPTALPALGFVLVQLAEFPLVRLGGALSTTFSQIEICAFPEMVVYALGNED